MTTGTAPADIASTVVMPKCSKRSGCRSGSSPSPAACQKIEARAYRSRSSAPEASGCSTTGQPVGHRPDLVEVGPVLGGAPADEVVLPARPRPPLDQVAERVDHLELLLVVAGAGQEEPPHRQDHRVLVAPGHGADGRVEQAAGAVPQPLDPPLGVPRVRHQAVVRVEVGGHARSGRPARARPGPARRAIRRRRARRSRGRRARRRSVPMPASAGTQVGLRRSTRTASPGGTSTSNRRATLRRRSRRDDGTSTVAVPITSPSTSARTSIGATAAGR